MLNIDLSKTLAFLNYLQLLRLTLFMWGKVESSTQLDTRYTEYRHNKREEKKWDVRPTATYRDQNHKSQKSYVLKFRAVEKWEPLGTGPWYTLL